MASNNQQEQGEITKTELWKMIFRSLFLQSSFNYERMQAGGWLYSLMPALKKVHKKKDELSAAMKRHLEFFNTHPFLITPVLGIIAAMEEKKEDPQMIRSIKVALMGPLGGIGDALLWMTLLPITAGIGVSLAKQGNASGPIVFFLLFNAVHLVLRVGGMFYGYYTGVQALKKLKAGAKAISRAASILGVTVIGGLIASYISLSLKLNINVEGNKINVQKEVLDKILPNMLPLAYTLLLYYLIKKGYSPLKLVGITVCIGVIGKYIGLL